MVDLEKFKKAKLLCSLKLKGSDIHLDDSRETQSLLVVVGGSVESFLEV